MRRLILAFLVTASTLGIAQEVTQHKGIVIPIPRSKIHPETFTTVSPSTRVSSTNWSGYVAGQSLTRSIAGSVTTVSGSWNVPTVHAPATTVKGGTDSAIWVGIDGFTDGTVEQIGTSHNWISNAQQNYAWFEMYPGGAYEILNFPLNRGDQISAAVNYIGGNTYQLILTNNTHNVSFTVPYAYTKSSTAQRSSAEWVVEAPYENGVLPLANFGTITFTNCYATIEGTRGSINDHIWSNDVVTMTTGTATKAQPSMPLVNGTSFTVTWGHQ